MALASSCGGGEGGAHCTSLLCPGWGDLWWESCTRGARPVPTRTQCVLVDFTSFGSELRTAQGHEASDLSVLLLVIVGMGLVVWGPLWGRFCSPGPGFRPTEVPLGQ